ncbi:MAG: 3-isopropylmalate dehydrogenase [Firmicutes bacterium]|nr:3-isopropylmalate dehydrogenase [Bacillota bacterium]MDI6705781.1 3-isopropylmalate dehydrogenase [Bacillota bacterium]
MIRIAVLPGDGIGPEVCSQAVKVLRHVCKGFSFTEAAVGGAALDSCGLPLPSETLKLCKESDSILLGAVGGPKWNAAPPHLRPEQAILQLRKELNIYANLRPIVSYPMSKDSSPLKPGIVEKGIDILIVRELNGGIYFGPKSRERTSTGYLASDTEIYSTDEIERIAHAAFGIAKKRTRKVTSVDKANVLESSRLWRETVEKISLQYPEIDLEHMYIDNCAMQLILNPSRFDVILTNNMFGDILSDEASVITGSIGMMPSASIGGQSFGLYEPIHGSAPDIAGQNKANPIAAILSAAMMLRLSFNMYREANAIENAVEKALNMGYRTSDIMSSGCKEVGTSEMGELIIAGISC